uniref:Uncharacterized protein n=1 Tax=Oryza rufipogon TaxID=4529 RepID=A0A0E0P3U2_ORYRU
MADSRLSTVPSWLPVGMDPLTTYLLEIKLAGDRKNARMIDSNAMCYKDFVDDIAKSYPWGPNETVTIGYVDMLDHTLVKANICVPDTPSLATPSQVDFSQPSSSTLPSHVLVPSDTYLINPFPMAEHVGVDDECIYLDNEEAVAGQADETRDNEEAVAGQADETRGEGVANEESEDESWATSEDTSKDASEGDGVDESEDERLLLVKLMKLEVKGLPMKNPRMNLGLHLRIHLRMHLRVMVKTNPFPHECSSTRRSETIKAASKSRSLTGSNQPEPSNMIVALPCLGEQTPPVAPKKAKSKTKGKPPCSAVPNSPAMGTRSKNKSPAMGTRSKRKLMD